MTPFKKVGSILLIDEQQSFAHLIKGVLGRLEQEMGEIHFATLADRGSLSAYLNREGEYFNAPTPNLILDTNVPSHEQTAYAAGLDDLEIPRDIPVIPLIIDKENLVAKPELIDDYQPLFKTLIYSWFDSVKLN